MGAASHIRRSTGTGNSGFGRITASAARIICPDSDHKAVYPVSDTLEFSNDTLPPEDTSKYRTVAWQHVGVQLDGRGNAYKSKRIARVSTQPSASFGTLTPGVEATHYRGNDSRLSASVKIAGSTPGTGHLWLRVDRGSERGFFNNMNERPVFDSTWQ